MAATLVAEDETSTRDTRRQQKQKQQLNENEENKYTTIALRRGHLWSGLILDLVGIWL